MFYSGIFQNRWDFLEMNRSNLPWARKLDMELTMTWWQKLSRRNNEEGSDSFDQLSRKGSLTNERSKLLSTSSTSSLESKSQHAGRPVNKWISMIGCDDRCASSLQTAASSEGWVNVWSTGGGLSWVPVRDVVVKVDADKKKKLSLSYDAFVPAAKLSFGYKDQWFARKLNILKLPWEAGHVDLSIRRESILIDSMTMLNRMDPSDFYKVWKICFVGEPGRDAGGLTREWLECLAQEIFSPELGLFIRRYVYLVCMTLDYIYIYICVYIISMLNWLHINTSNY